MDGGRDALDINGYTAMPRVLRPVRMVFTSDNTYSIVIRAIASRASRTIPAQPESVDTTESSSPSPP